MDKYSEKDVDLFLGEEFKDDKEVKDLIKNDIKLSDLDSYLNDLWDDAYTAKIDEIEDELMECLRQRKAEYSSEVLAKIQSMGGGSKNYHSLTAEKCRAMQDFVLDFTLSDGIIPFSIDPTPIPELPDEINKETSSSVGYKILDFIKGFGRLPNKQDISEIKKIIPDEQRSLNKEAAERKAKLVEIKLRDKLVESNINKAFSDFVSDFATYPNAFLYGPIISRKKELCRKTKPNAETGKQETVIEEKEKTYFNFRRISPFDVYPEPNIENIQDGYVFIRELVSRAYAESLRSEPGYKKDKIEMALDEFNNGYSENENRDPLNEDEKKSLENKTNNVEDEKGKLYMSTFWGKISGEKLKDFGIMHDKDEKPVDDYKEYDVWCVRIGRFVVKVQFNPYPLNEIPLHTSSAYKEPGSFWHTGLPKVVRTYQKSINTAIRALQDNTAFSSKPIFDVNIANLAKNFELTQITPGMLIQTSHDTANMNNRGSLNPIDTPIKAETLIYEIDKLQQYADSACGIPRYMHGGQGPASGAGRTASGLSMMMNSSSTKIKQIISNIDRDVIEPVIKMLYNWCLIKYDDFKDLGDIKIVPGGVSSIVNKEQDVTRMIEFLRNLSTPMLAPIVGESGFRKLIYKIGRAFGIGPMNGIVPSEDEYKLTKKVQEFQMMQQQMLMQQQAQQTQGNQAPGEKNLQPNGAEQGKVM